MRETLLTFALIFLAALPGRTTFLLILLGASIRPARIFLGAIPAFVVQCALGVMAGQALKNVPQFYVQLAAGLLFLYFAVKFWFESRPKEKLPEGVAERSIFSIFLLFFVAELGDVSQLAVASRASQSTMPWETFFGSGLAMSAIVILAVILGRGIGTKLSANFLQKAAAAIFFFLGAYLLWSAESSR